MAVQQLANTQDFPVKGFHLPSVGELWRFPFIVMIQGHVEAVQVLAEGLEGDLGDVGIA